MVKSIPAGLLLLVGTSLVTAKSGGLQSGPEFFATPSTPFTAGTALPFSEAVRVGKTLFVSGQIGVLPGTLSLVQGGIGPEANQVMGNIKSILERHGSSMDQIVKCTVFLADIKEWPAFNDVYREFFKSHFPVRSALAASGLAYNARVEVDCIAVLR